MILILIKFKLCSFSWENRYRIASYIIITNIRIILYTHTYVSLYVFHPDDFKMNYKESYLDWVAKSTYIKERGFFLKT